MDRKLIEARALLASAEAEAKDAKARLAKINRDYSHSDLSIAEWRGFCDELEPEEVAARAEVERLREQVKAAESGAAVGAAEAQVIEQLAELRAAIAGDVNAAGESRRCGPCCRGSLRASCFIWRSQARPTLS